MRVSTIQCKVDGKYCCKNFSFPGAPWTAYAIDFDSFEEAITFIVDLYDQYLWKSLVL